MLFGCSASYNEALRLQRQHVGACMSKRANDAVTSTGSSAARSQLPAFCRSRLRTRRPSMLSSFKVITSFGRFQLTVLQAQ